MSSPAEPEGNEQPKTGASAPSAFTYSVTYPTSQYSTGSGQTAGLPGAEEPSAAGEVPFRRGPTAKLLGLAAAGLLVGFAAVLVWGGWHSRSGPDLTIGPTPAASAPSSDHAAAQAVEAWLRDGGQLVIDNLAADYHKVAAATAANDVQGLVPACGALRTSAETAQAYPPIPDSEAQVHWSASLAQSARAGTDCLAGVIASHLELVTQAGHEAGASSRESALMNARIATLRGN